MKQLAFLFLLPLLWSCSPQQADQVGSLAKGTWRAHLSTEDGQQIPFLLEVAADSANHPRLFLVNGEEKLQLDEIQIVADSVFISMHIFNTEIRAKMTENRLDGYWIKKDYDDYRMPFVAVLGAAPRFEVAAEPAIQMTGKYQVYFYSETNPTDTAVGVFEQNGGLLKGTFLTRTGDYRYLAGVVDGTQMKLSCFDGEHAYLFTADITGDSLTNGIFRSGKTYSGKWAALRNEQAALPDPDQLTFLKPGYDRFEFTFPNTAGQPVSLTDPRYQGKVVVVQIMGTWCPNCMDETKFLNDFYKRYQAEGLEIIALAYERKPEFDYAKGRVEKVRDRLGIGYEILIAGVNDKAKAAETLPMLNRLLAFPTTIIIDRQGKVRRIHTGFSGPGTGVYYEEFVEKFTALIKGMLAESPNA